VPEYEPVVDGEKVTVTVCAEAPEATPKLDGFTVKAELLLERLETVRVALPVFPTVKVRWLEVPAVTFPNAMEEPETEMAGVGPETPVPVTETSVGLPAAL